MSVNKSDGPVIKRSVARIVSQHVTFLLIIAMIILLAGSYWAVANAIYRESDEKSEGVLRLYAELLADYSKDNQIPLDEMCVEYAERLGSEICIQCGIDYVYLYVIDEERSARKYYVLTGRENLPYAAIQDLPIGAFVVGDLYPDELAIWNGDLNLARLTSRNAYGHEINTLSRITDCNGNRVIIGVDVSYQEVMSQIIRGFLLLGLAEAFVIVGVAFALYFILKKRVSTPAKLISQSMQEYMSNGTRSDVRLEINGSDEYAMIASAFNSMTLDIDNYVNNIQNLTREQSNRQTELDIASNIQRGFLPKEQFRDNECDIRALMIPAKDVGGDLYDYIRLDDDRVLIVIADVSGKGISAAMFMSVTLTLIRQFAKMGLEPHEILRRTNDALAENNAQLLFTTAFIGLYDRNKQTFTYSNAGHNLPYLVGREIRALEGANGLLLGLFPGEEYSSETIPLRIGETVLLYTDGITEATDPEDNFFGDDRLENVLREFKASKEADIVKVVYDAVKRFADKAEQHDDITMLALTPKNTISFDVRYEIEEFDRIKDEILKLPLPHEQQLDFCLAAEEVFANICSYAFDGNAPDTERIGFSLTVSRRIEITFTDSGTPYNPLEQIAVPDPANADLSAGGFGKYLYKILTDDAQYEYLDGKNNLAIFKMNAEAQQ